MPQPNAAPSTPSLIARALRETAALFTTEITLARLEASEKLTLALASLVSLVVAAVFVVVALIFLLQGVVELLIANGFAAFAASFTVGGAIAAAAFVAVVVASRNLSATRLKPSRTLRQVEDARDFVKGRVR